MVVHVATLGNSVFARARIFFLVTRCKKFPSRISHIPIKSLVFLDNDRLTFNCELHVWVKAC
jgi:hypothetical protein